MPSFRITLGLAELKFLVSIKKASLPQRAHRLPAGLLMDSLEDKFQLKTAVPSQRVECMWDLYTENVDAESVVELLTNLFFLTFG